MRPFLFSLNINLSHKHAWRFSGRGGAARNFAYNLTFQPFENIFTHRPRVVRPSIETDEAPKLKIIFIFGRVFLLFPFWFFQKVLDGGDD
jgi:hypothetical protein